MKPYLIICILSLIAIEFILRGQGATGFHFTAAIFSGVIILAVIGCYVYLTEKP